MSAFDHPNVAERRSVVPQAVSFKTVDGRVRSECVDRGAWPETPLEQARGDFLYALPPDPVQGVHPEDPAPRQDGVPGHRDGRVRVYRPRALFESQILGRYPLNVEIGLFNPGAWDAAVERWKAGPPAAQLGKLPDRIGVDAAREGDDDTCFAPAWGESTEQLLRTWDNAERERNEKVKADLLENRRVRVGEIRIAPKGRGPEVAKHIAGIYGHSPWNVDEGGVGASVLDHAKDVLRLDAVGVSFAAVAPARLPEEYWCENMRAALYVRAAMLIDRGLVDVPDDRLLREEVLAHRLVFGERTVEENGQKWRAQTVRILEKDEIKKKIKRSPDRADAFVLSLFSPARFEILIGRAW
jgi:hypothetical protein